MALWVPNGAGDFTASVSNVDAVRPTSVWGTVSGASGAKPAKGTYATILSALAFDCYGIYVASCNAANSATDEDGLIDVGVDPAGGTSFSAVIPNLLMSCTSPYATGGPTAYYFPLWIKAGSSVGVAYVESHNNANHMNLVMRVVGKPRYPARIWCGTKVDAFGVDTTNIRGTIVTPGTTSEGAFTALATGIANDYEFWQLGMGCNDTTMSALVYSVDLAFGSSTTVNSLIIQDQLYIANANEILINQGLVAGCQRRVPSGSNLYGRVQCSGTADSNISVAAYGVRS